LSLQLIVQVEPPHEMGSVHAFGPVHSMSHALAAVQSMSLVHALSPHATRHGTFGGQTILSAQLPLVLQSNLHVPFVVQVPPASGHSVAQRLAASGGGGGESSGASEPPSLMVTMSLVASKLESNPPSTRRPLSSSPHATSAEPMTIAAIHLRATAQA